MLLMIDNNNYFEYRKIFSVVKLNIIINIIYIIYYIIMKYLIIIN